MSSWWGFQTTISILVVCLLQKFVSRIYEYWCTQTLALFIALHCIVFFCIVLFYFFFTYSTKQINLHFLALKCIPVQTVRIKLKRAANHFLSEMICQFKDAMLSVGLYFRYFNTFLPKQMCTASYFVFFALQKKQTLSVSLENWWIFQFSINSILLVRIRSKSIGIDWFAERICNTLSEW